MMHRPSLFTTGHGFSQEEADLMNGAAQQLAAKWPGADLMEIADAIANAFPDGIAGMSKTERDTAAADLLTNFRPTY